MPVELSKIGGENFPFPFPFRFRRKFRGESVVKSLVHGTLRYEVLKRARFRCELCGISAYEKALEVDHILPRNHGGSDDISNLQTLCYSCNAMKRDRDDTDFRNVRESYEHREKDCLFCEIEKVCVLAENQLGYLIFDNFPVTEFHSLVIPKQHVPTYFDLGQSSLWIFNRFIHRCCKTNSPRERSGLLTQFYRLL